MASGCGRSNEKSFCCVSFGRWHSVQKLFCGGGKEEVKAVRKAWGSVGCLRDAKSARVLYSPVMCVVVKGHFILDSRTATTSALAKAIAASNNKSLDFLVASGVGAYGKDFIGKGVTAVDESVDIS
ncbi:hypothetical protein IV203_011586 [Nitzschia inconspicua]|uniref:Uncharacterized protein n=1 Tax=Nitzschia inconspicua TaxID=303405 RepID=A0A9K3PL56_9STRA|nr:hypothetical protein IV203_011586 [Nitzschia inconspicua]